ncbi:MAG: SHOCT domain-containing protein [Clostridiales bacterium]|nr:SHOCT domain-containing protein [Clostridiales bacterium]
MAIYGYDLLFTNPSVIVGGFKVVSIIFAWVIFVTTIAMIVGLILSFTKLKNTKAQKIMQLVVVGSACTCAFFYMIVGILSTVGVDKYHDFSTYYQYGYYWTTTTEAINEFTIAYIPLILQAVCLVFVLVNFFKNRKELVCVKNSEETIVANETLTNTPNQKIVSTVNASIIEDIKKFKELLDMGAITQEEYDAKKKELLGL